MSRKYPALAASQVTHALRQNDFYLAAQKGSHQKWRHPDGRQVIVPVHGSKIIPIGTLKNIIDASSLSVDAFRK